MNTFAVVLLQLLQQKVFIAKKGFCIVFLSSININSLSADIQQKNNLPKVTEIVIQVKIYKNYVKFPIPLTAD